MDTWQFYQKDGTEWCWKHVAVTGIVTEGERCWPSRTDCIADAMRHGYLTRQPIVAARAAQTRFFVSSR